VLRQNFNDTTTLGARFDVPLEIATRIVEHRIQLVGNELIRRKDPEILGVSANTSQPRYKGWMKCQRILFDDGFEEPTHRLHAALLRAPLDAEALPLWDHQWRVSVETLFLLPEALLCGIGDEAEDLRHGNAVGSEQLFRTVGLEPRLQCGELLRGCLRAGEGHLV
jgi:hypothetical protein